MHVTAWRLHACTLPGVEEIELRFTSRLGDLRGCNVVMSLRASCALRVIRHAAETWYTRYQYNTQLALLHRHDRIWHTIHSWIHTAVVSCAPVWYTIYQVPGMHVTSRFTARYTPSPYPTRPRAVSMIVYDHSGYMTILFEYRCERLPAYIRGYQVCKRINRTILINTK